MAGDNSSIAMVSVDGIDDDDGGDPRTMVQFYQDYSGVPPELVRSSVADPKNRVKFPVLLHKLVSSGDYADSIAWKSHGRSFTITDWDKFCEKATLHHFCTQDHEKIMQWINAYNFRLIEYDHDTGKATFYHERFLQHHPWLAYTMRPWSI
ncbi:hypothetical protein ACHAWF_003522 [Thalassiosira exigua]